MAAMRLSGKELPPMALAVAHGLAAAAGLVTLNTSCKRADCSGNSNGGIGRICSSSAGWCLSFFLVSHEEKTLVCTDYACPCILGGNLFRSPADRGLQQVG
ncbi:MAG TPA: hypothetical protein VGL27_02945 [Negativicutes bacterium]